MCTTVSESIHAASGLMARPSGGPAVNRRSSNCAATLTTSLSAQQLCALLHNIEDHEGRLRTLTWGPRTCDLDLLLFDDQVIDEPSLQVPHPRMAARSFVLGPAAEIAGAWSHPGIGTTLAELWACWQTASGTIALLGSDDTRSWLLQVARETHFALAQLAPIHAKLQGKPSTLLATRAEGAVEVPGLAITTTWADAIPGWPTLRVDSKQRELAIRDTAAALGDLWPHLGSAQHGA